MAKTSANGMSFLDYTKKALDIALHPGNINESYSVGDALAFYYKAAVIPAIAAAVLGFLLLFALGSIALGLFSYLSNILGIAALGGVLLGIVGAVIGLAYVLLFIPIGIVLDGAIYHFFAKTLFKLWNKDISKTITATMYGAFPEMLFIWAIFIPIIGPIVLFAAGIWSLVVLIISMARQQGVSGWRAFGGILISGIILGVIIMVLEFAVIATIGVGIAHAASYCLPNPGFVCSGASFSSGTLKATMGQSLGIKMMKATVFFVPFGTNLSTSDPAYYIGNLSSGATAPITISRINEINGTTFGNLTVEYYTSISQTTPYVKNVATFGS